jgi:type I restriction enzyme M protein
VERPQRLYGQLSVKAIESLRFASGDEDIRTALYEEFGDALFEGFAGIVKALEKRLAEWGNGEEEEEDNEESSPSRGLSEKKKKKLLDPRTWERDGRLVETATLLRKELGGDVFEDHNAFREKVDETLEKWDRKVPAGDLKIILRAVSRRVETAPPVIAKIYKPGKMEPAPLYGRYEIEIEGKRHIVEYEPDTDLRDTEQVPLLEEGGIEAFIRREVLPYTPDAWIKDGSTKIGYEISFTSHFYKPQPLRTLEEIKTDIIAIEKEAEGLLDDLLKGDG